MKRSELMHYARMGAESRLAQIEAEMQSLKSLAGNGEVKRPVRKLVSKEVEPVKKKRTMSAANRKAVALRMKRYWKAWRAAKGVGR